MQQEVHYVGPISVVPVEGLTRGELFDGIKPHARGDVFKAKENEEIVLCRLRKWIPAFVENIHTSKDNWPSYFGSVCYNILLPHGKVGATIKISDDLGKSLSGGVTLGCGGSPFREVSGQFNGRSGVIINAEYNLDGYNDGRLITGFPNLFQDKWDVLTNTQKALNAICQEKELTEEIVRGNKSLEYPLFFHGGEIKALVKDASLEAVRAIDQPVSEFFSWIQENEVQIKTLGELILLAHNSYLIAKKHSEITEAIKVSTKLPTTVKSVGDQYLKLAQEAYAQLHPPKNNRMDYLVH